MVVNDGLRTLKLWPIPGPSLSKLQHALPPNGGDRNRRTTDELSKTDDLYLKPRSEIYMQKYLITD